MCGGVENRRVFNEHGIDIVRCRSCGHVFSSYPANPHHAGYWGEEVEESDHVYWKTARAPMYEDFFGRFIAGRSGRLLDMGCGLGFFVKAMGAHPAWETHGCEISPAAVRYGVGQLGIANLHLGRVEDASFPAGSFDLVTLWDVLEHLRDPDPLLRHLHGLLAPSGALFLHTPNVHLQVPKAKLRRRVRGMQPGGHYLEAKDHLHLYSPRTLRVLLTRNGFSRVRFVHLHPIQSVVGENTAVGRAVKNLWFQAARGLHRATAGALNLDNLFVVARPGP
jgi:SAM-dependent methyltransferase